MEVEKDVEERLIRKKGNEQGGGAANQQREGRMKVKE